MRGAAIRRTGGPSLQRGDWALNDLLSISVLICAGAATLWLVIYVRLILPRRIEEKFFESMSAFSRAVELRFPGHRGMAEDIEVASVRLGRQMRLSKQSMQRLKTSARLMDIGLCALPYKLINQKASYEWSDAERSTYDRHPEISGAMLDLVPSLKGIAKIVRMHHAPFQADLPVEARVLKVASDYAWLFRQMGEKRAQELILGKVGEEYCPEVVDALAEVLRSSRVQEREHCLA